MTVSELEARAKSDSAPPEGSAYGATAIQAFWGKNPSFMRKCAGPDAPVAEPFTIFVEILENGSMGQLEANPSTKVAKCVVENIHGRSFPKPPYPYVLQIDLSFKR